MDTTPENIKMLRKAWEIQKLRPQIMVNSTRHYYKGEYQYEIDVDGTIRFCYGSDYIWLPRQDNLQDIYADYVADQLGVVKGRTELMQAFLDFTEWLRTQYYEENFVCLPTNVFSSGEQLWLAFVMKEKYGKTWCEGEWV